MNRVIAVIIILMITGCGLQNEIEESELSQSDVNGEIEGADTKNEFIMSEGVREFIALLEDRGYDFTTTIIEEQSDYIPGNRLRIDLLDEMIIVHQFESEISAKEYTKEFDSKGFTIGNNKISWISDPHFYNNWDLIIEYIGVNREIVDLLDEILGEQFSGINSYEKK